MYLYICIYTLVRMCFVSAPGSQIQVGVRSLCALRLASAYFVAALGHLLRAFACLAQVSARHAPPLSFRHCASTASLATMAPAGQKQIAQALKATSQEREGAAQSSIVAAPQPVPNTTPMNGKEGSLVAQQLAKSTNKRRQPRSARTTEAIVAKVIYDNFRSLTAAQVDTITIDKLTLRQRLIEDRETESKRPGTFSFGANYYKSLRTMYAGDADPVKLLTAPFG